MGTRERRAREKEQRRQDILDAARTLFRASGYDGTTMPQIAQAAELAPGTLYLYFPSKQALYAELLIEGYDLLLERLQTAIQTDAPPRQQAETLIDVFMAFAREYPEYFDIIFFIVQREGHAVAALDLPAQQRERLAAHQDACKHLAAQVLERAGIAAAGAPLDLTVDAVWSMLAGVVLYFHRDEPDAFAAVAARAKQLILHSLFGA